MGRLIDADTVVHWQSYDDEHETFPEKTGTIAELIDQMTDEGCPEAVDAVPVRRGLWIQVSQDRANCNRCNCESGKMIKQGERYFPKFCPECGADMRKVTMTDYPTREYIIRETTYPYATKQEVIGELVWCKDCQYWERDHELDGYPLFEGHMVCKYAIGHSFVRHPHDFCSKGVRKDCNNEAD